MSELYLGLVHGPVKNKRGNIVTTSVTNLDIHDISRSCRTFGVKRYFLVTSLKAQHELVNRILGHWNEDESALYNPDRKDALNVAKLINTVEDAIEEIEKIEGKKPIVAVTGAGFKEYAGTPSELKNKMESEDRPCLLLFGTGWGLSDHVVDLAEFKLEPLFGVAKDGYNHLSVRSAVAIYLDRIQARR